MKKLAFIFAALSAVALAQTDAPKPTDAHEFNRLDFVLRETENGKLINTRNFQMMALADQKAASLIRSGDKIPVPAVGPGGTTIYIDVGVNRAVRQIHRINDELTRGISAEASTSEPGTNVVRAAKWESVVLIPIRKPVVIFSSDGPTAKRQLQLEITATPIH